MLLLLLLWSAVSLCLAAPTTTTTSELVVLTSSNWTTHIAHDVWLINFCSSVKAPKCKGFTDTWAELVRTKASLSSDYPDAPFSLAYVDCSLTENIAMCSEAHVDQVPMLSVYKRGEQVIKKFTGGREYIVLSEFIDQQALMYRTEKQVSHVPHPVPHAKPPPVDVLDVKPAADAAVIVPPPPSPPKADAPAAVAVPPAEAAAPLSPPPAANPMNADPDDPVGPKGPNEEGALLAFGQGPLSNLEDFRQFLGKGAGRGASFVKFFAPWCPHCKAMKLAFERLATTLKGRVNVIEVDCVAHEKVCQEFQVESYPTLRMYNDGEMTSFDGSRSHDAMMEWALKAGSSGVQELAEEKEFEDAIRREDIVFLWLHEPGSPDVEENAIEYASRVLLTTTTHLYRSSSPALLARYSSVLRASPTGPKIGSTAPRSALLVFKDHEARRWTEVYHPSLLSGTLEPQAMAREIAGWLDRERYATVSEVTGTTFADVINNKQHALVVLAALSDIYHASDELWTGSGSQLREAQAKRVRELALQWREREKKNGKAGGGTGVLWATIDADRWAGPLHQYYGLKPGAYPALLAIDGARLKYAPLPSYTPTTLPPSPDHSDSDHATQAWAERWLDPETVFTELEAVSRGEVKMKSSRGYLDRGVQGVNGAIQSVATNTESHPLASLSFIFFACGAVFWYLRRTGKRGRGGTMSSKAGASSGPLLGGFAKSD